MYNLFPDCMAYQLDNQTIIINQLLFTIKINNETIMN